LSLFVFWIAFTYDKQNPSPTDEFAFGAYFLYRSFYFHPVRSIK